MSGISNRISISGTGKGTEVTKPETKTSLQPEKNSATPNNDGLTTLPFSADMKKGVTDWFRQKGLSVKVIDSNKDGQVDPQDIFPEDSKVSPEKVKEELNKFAQYIGDIPSSEKAKLQKFLETKYGESFIVDDQDTYRGGNNNKKIDQEELVFADQNIDKQEVLQNYQMSKLVVGAQDEPKDNDNASDAKYPADRSFAGIVTLGTNVEKKHINKEIQGTAFFSGDFRFPVRDIFTINVSGLFTSNPALINKSLTNGQIKEGYYPGGFAVNKLFSDLIWKSKGVTPIFSFGFLPEYSNNWLSKVNFKHFPAGNSDNLEHIIQSDRLGVGFSVNKLFDNIDNVKFPLEAEISAQTSGGPYFPGGIILENNNKLKDNIGYWAEGIGSVRNWWQFTDFLKLEYGVSLGINNKGYKEDSERKNKLSTDFQQAVALNFDLGKNWQLNIGSNFGQQWETQSNSVSAKESSNVELKSGITQQLFAHSYRPFLGIITPTWENIGGVDFNIIGDISQNLWKTKGEEDGNEVVYNSSKISTNFAIEALWHKAFGQDWLSVGMNGGFNSNAYSGDKSKKEQWGYLTAYLRFNF